MPTNGQPTPSSKTFGERLTEFNAVQRGKLTRKGQGTGTLAETIEDAYVSLEWCCDQLVQWEKLGDTDAVIGVRMALRCRIRDLEERFKNGT